VKTLNYFVWTIPRTDQDRGPYPISWVAMNDKFIPMDGLYDLLEIDPDMTECFEATVQEALENSGAEVVRMFHWEHGGGITIFWWVTITPADPEFPVVTRQTLLRRLPEAVFNGLDLTLGVDVKTSSVGDYLSAFEKECGENELVSWLKVILEDFHELGLLTWRP
jgi:hypothetical protein